MEMSIFCKLLWPVYSSLFDIQGRSFIELTVAENLALHLMECLF